MRKTLIAASLLSCLMVTPSFAAEKPVKASAQTQLDLYATATEAWDILNQDSRAILIDVRDPIEIKFTGFATPTRIHVPWMVADTQRWNDKQGWAMVKNTNFVQQVTDKLTQLNATTDTPIIMMCRSGSTRSAPAVDVLAEQGYTNVWTVVDGFEGGKLKEGDSKGVRALNGWRNSGLPWSYKVDRAVAWHPAK
ncbi:rhodanese-like domain-containing protein [Amphritea sp. 1_MG-2023]|uniref:rhodanese-like domain-containing protein n=1 Tax=Amphritea sp. 1_MG-2023 TaxID=3062670 RepID=UPI0026E3A116|nr:rhodanese-like domain-containing protein [Amphritea sp. 1_MG-2023]MDO6562110.1 rhodanese-like domain-containing protein [Amphritea sp. 1_MG-2023]